MCHTSYITVHCTQSVLYCVHNIVPWEHFSNISTKFKPPPFASICCCYSDPPLLSAKTLFNAARQCYFEMKPNKEPCFSILSIIILCLRPFFIFVYSVFSFGVLYREHSQLAFDCVVIACSLESIRPGLVQGCKAPNGVG